MTNGKPPRPGSSDIELSSGAYLNLADPDPAVITVEVVAHHLANVCRYAGAVRRPYSVAEHALLVAGYLTHHEYDYRVVLGGLHHDDGEAFCGDQTRPMKELIRPLFEPVEERLLGAVAQALDFAALGVETHLPAIKEADNWALAAEAYHLMPSRGRDWWCDGMYDPNSPDNPPIKDAILCRPDALSHKAVVNAWLHNHYTLIGEVRACPTPR